MPENKNYTCLCSLHEASEVHNASAATRVERRSSLKLLSAVAPLNIHARTSRSSSNPLALLTASHMATSVQRFVSGGKCSCLRSTVGTFIHHTHIYSHSEHHHFYIPPERKIILQGQAGERRCQLWFLLKRDPWMNTEAHCTKYCAVTNI